MQFLLCRCYVATAFLLSGCHPYNLRQNHILAIPLQPTLQQEILLARFEQGLTGKTLTNNERVQLLYERGVLYDGVGLRVLARNDFLQVLAIRPNTPEVFNYLGIYLTQAGNFDAAYEAFDSVLELDPTYNYALLNRGIALYYGGRFQLAQSDLQAFYHDDPNDPLRSLWLYLAEQEINRKMAKVALLQRYEKSNKNGWEWSIIEFYLGGISEVTLMNRLKIEAKNNTSLAESLSEVDFYLGKYYLSLGNKNAAVALFKLALANNVHYFVEHRYALLELALLEQGQHSLSESD